MICPGLGEGLPGCQIMSYWEDQAHFKRQNAFSNRKPGTRFWIGQQIRLANNFLSILDHLAGQVGYMGKIRIVVAFKGLKGRVLDSPTLDDDYGIDCKIHQDTKRVDFMVERQAIAAETRDATIVSIIQPVNTLAQGKAVTIKTVREALTTGIYKDGVFLR